MPGFGYRSGGQHVSQLPPPPPSVCTITAPPPVLAAGSRVSCPCSWSRRSRSARALRAYRKHWYRRHRDGA